ncbi:predicted protein [Lichtheimia corymbifera JMRC:FSU:9682]|uniref:Uncharacterized protein n=1 Tax=Lichtheimia corymbifera JMRC:FSU:9682 TaxID=1263082 RepID=A0A068SA91_9FUNG|nr:predicted protein [Lichtheimia corymbifera JMRC:FSU:9682]
MATATNCRKVSLIRTNLYPDSASTLVEDAHISHPNATSTTGTTATTANNFFQPAFFMLLFSRLIDAVIFTSAIAITAYNYWTGDLPQPAANHQVLISSAPAPSRTSSSSRSKRNSYASASSPLVQVRRRMTEEWAADTLQDNDQQDSHHQHHNRASTYARPTFASMNKFHSSPAIVGDQQPHKNQQHVRTKHRSKSFNQPKQSQDEMLARMQTQLENLIQEGQAALNSPAFDMSDDDDEDGRNSRLISSPSASKRSRRINQKKHQKRYSSVFP